MRRSFLSLSRLVCGLLFLSVSGLLYANVITGVAAVPENYYIGVDGKSSSDAILDALFSKISGHTIISYNALEDYYEQTDFTGDTVWDMYSTCRFTMAEANKAQNSVCDGWNKEHSIPQSWFNGGSPMKSDLFHVYPTDARVNNFRSNLPYGEVNGQNGAGFSDNYKNHGLGKKGSNTFPGYTGSVFEPADEYKGDFARTYFYMVARYRDKSFTSSGGNAVFTSSKTNLTTFAKNLFMKWHRQDPVSQKEIDRNEAVYKLQNNRNPFIDYPDLAEYIWGDRVGQSVDLSKMVPTCDGGGSTPIVIVKHGVTWSVNGTDEKTDSVKENFRPALPSAPVSCSAESAVFVGWTDAPIEGIMDEAPVLYTASADFPAVTEDVTYYAVFAHETLVEGNSVPKDVTFDFNTMGLTDRQVIPNPVFEKEGVTITFAGGNTDPTYYTGAIRLYASGTMTVEASDITQIDFTFGANDKSNPITAAPGTYDKDNNRWTGDATDQVVFTIGDSSGHRKIATTKVTMNGSGVTTTYSRYITVCQQPTEVERVGVDTPAQKILVGGQLYILRGERIYTLQGQLINHK